MPTRKKIPSAAKRRNSKTRIDFAVSSIAGLLVVSASVLDLLNLDGWLNSVYGKVLIVTLSTIAGGLVGSYFYRIKDGKRDE